MLQKIVLSCVYDAEQKASYNWGSLFHGLLMESLPPEIAAELHHNQLRPFSQFVKPEGEGKISWHIGLWDQDIAEYIIKAVVPLTQINLEQKGLTLKVVEAQRFSLNKIDFFKRFFTCPNPVRIFEITFITPCAHKEEGHYTIFPNLELIVKNLARRYSAFNTEYSLEDPEAMLQLARHMHIFRYSLRSALFYLESTRIPGYIGKISLRISGPEQLARLGGTLLSFGEYSGIGIKTALGMGGVQVEQIIKEA